MFWSQLRHVYAELCGNESLPIDHRFESLVSSKAVSDDGGRSMIRASGGDERREALPVRNNWATAALLSILLVLVNGCGDRTESVVTEATTASAKPKLEMDIFAYRVPAGRLVVAIGSTLTNVSSETVRVGDMYFRLPDVDGDGKPDGDGGLTAGGQPLRKGESLPLTFEIPMTWNSSNASTIEVRDREQLAAIRRMEVEIKDEQGKPIDVSVRWPAEAPVAAQPAVLDCNEVLSARANAPKKDDVVRCMVERLRRDAIEHLHDRARNAPTEIEKHDATMRMMERSLWKVFLWEVSEKGLRATFDRYEREHDWSRGDIDDAIVQIRSRTREAIEKAQPETMSQYQQRNFEALRKIVLDAIDSGTSL